MSTLATSRDKPPVTITDRPWTSTEVQEMRRMAPLGAEAVAEVLERSVRSVRQQAHRLRISLRRTGERRGMILGQPRGRTLDPALREAVIAGVADPARAESLGIAKVLGRSDCPACGTRPAEVASSGFCQRCHLEALALGHAMEADTAAAQRKVDRERQRKSRSKRKAASP